MPGDANNEGKLTLPVVRPCTPADMDALRAAAATDGHQVTLPTHLIERDGHIIGYFSIQPTVMLNAWVHSDKVRARESFHLLNLAENLAVNLTGLRLVSLPCALESPFAPVINHLGYQTLFHDVSLNLKQIGRKESHVQSSH